MPDLRDSSRIADESGRGESSSGGYYWFPTRDHDSVTWKVLTCYELGFGAEVGHIDLWPSVIDRLAEVWRKDGRLLSLHLMNHYTGLPRGRVTQSGGRFLVCHGRDAPVADWKNLVRGAFGFAGCPLRAVYDEHERMLSDDRRKVEEILGIVLGPGLARGLSQNKIAKF